MPPAQQDSELHPAWPGLRLPISCAHHAKTGDKIFYLGPLHRGRGHGELLLADCHQTGYIIMLDTAARPVALAPKDKMPPSFQYANGPVLSPHAQGLRYGMAALSKRSVIRKLRHGDVPKLEPKRREKRIQKRRPTTRVTSKLNGRKSFS